MGARGDGSVEKLKSGQFRARVDLGRHADGRRNRPSKTFATRTEANNWKREQLRLHDAGTRPDAGDETLGQWLTRWLVTLRADLEPSSYRPHEARVRLYLTPTLGHVLLRDLQPKHVRALDERLIADGRSAATRLKVALTLRQALAAAVALRLIAASPAAGLPLPRSSRREFACWDAAQAAAFLRAAEASRHHVLFAVALDTGMRLGELVALHWPAVDLAAGVVSVQQSLYRRGKTRKLKPTKTRAGRRKITLAPQTLELLRAHHARQEEAGRLGCPVFCSQTGDYLHADHMRDRHFQPAIARAGVPRIRFHDLRHTCATLLLAAGVNVKAVSARLGHAGITVTLSVYGHVLPEMESQANLLASRTPARDNTDWTVQVCRILPPPSMADNGGQSFPSQLYFSTVTGISSQGRCPVMPPDQESLRSLLRSYLYRILAELRPNQLPHARRVRVRVGQRTAVLFIGPAAEVAQEQASAAQVGQWLSPLESAIWLAIGDGTLQGKEIAAKTGQEYNSTLKVILRNLVDRGVLVPVRGEGYRRAGRAPASAGPTESA